MTWWFLIHRPQDAGLIHFGIELVMGFSVLAAFIRLVVWQEEHRAPITTAALTILGLMYVPFLFNFVALLAFMPTDPAENRFLLIYLLAVTKFSDVGAYVVGSIIGRHKMIPRISPGKTWEGFAGRDPDVARHQRGADPFHGGACAVALVHFECGPGRPAAAYQRGGRPGRVGGEA